MHSRSCSVSTPRIAPASSAAATCNAPSPATGTSGWSVPHGCWFAPADPPTHRVTQVGHQLRELLIPHLLHRLGQFRHRQKLRVANNRGPAATRLMNVLAVSYT